MKKVLILLILLLLVGCSNEEGNNVNGGKADENEVNIGEAKSDEDKSNSNEEKEEELRDDELLVIVDGKEKILPAEKAEAKMMDVSIKLLEGYEFEDASDSTMKIKGKVPFSVTVQEYTGNNSVEKLALMEEMKLKNISESMGISSIERVDMENYPNIDWDYGYYYEDKAGEKYVFSKVGNDKHWGLTFRINKERQNEVNEVLAMVGSINFDKLN